MSLVFLTKELKRLEILNFHLILILFLLNILIKKNKIQKFKLEFMDIEGIGKLNPPESYIGMISYRLEKIEKILEKNK